VRVQPDRVPSQFVSYEDVLASVQRGNQVAARWRQKVGRLTREELERMQGGRPLNDAEEAFLREVQGKADRPAPERRADPTPARPVSDDEHLN
jgi:hypothetical protein